MTILDKASDAKLQDASAETRLNWYALRVFGNRTLWFRKVIEQKAGEDQMFSGVETYIPMSIIEKVVRQTKPHNKSDVSYSGNRMTMVMKSKRAVINESSKPEKSVAVQKPMVASLMFVRCTEKFLKELKMDYLSDFTYYSRYADLRDSEVQFKEQDLQKKLTNRRRYTAPVSLQKVPAVIPDEQMEAFIWMTSNDFDVKYLGEPKDLKLGDRVRITSGPLKGQTGNVKRIKKDRKFVITIGNVAAFTIEGITNDMMEKIDDVNIT